MANKKQIEEKSHPGTNFMLYIPINFSVSEDKNLKEKIIKAFGKERGGKIKIVNLSRKLKMEFLRHYGIEDESKFSKYPVIAQKIKEMKFEIMQEGGFHIKGFSEWARNKIEKLVKSENERKKKS